MGRQRSRHAGVLAVGAVLTVVAGWTFACIAAAGGADAVPGWALALSAGAAFGGGAWAGAKLGEVPGWPVALWVAMFMGVSGIAFVWADADIAGAGFRWLLAGPPAAGLVLYCGASVGYLGWGPDGRVVLRGFEMEVGRRFLLQKGSKVLSTVTALSLVGVTLGVALVIFVLAVLSGFEDDLRKNIIGAGGHVTVTRPNHAPFHFDPGAESSLRAAEGVSAVSRYLEGEVAVASTANYGGAILYGVEAEGARAVLGGVTGTITQGSLAALSLREEAAAPPEVEGEFPKPSPLPSVVIGAEMQRMLHVRVGDTLRLISPVLERMTPVGPVPTSQGFKVGGVFESGMFEYDARYMYAALPVVQRFLEQPDGITGWHVKVAAPDAAGSIAADLGESLRGFAAVDWMQKNVSLFSALKLERVVAFVVLGFVILVASFSIVNTLTMSAIEKMREIAILRTMGTHTAGIIFVFVTQGVLVGGTGTLLGVLLGLLLVAGASSAGLWIPAEAYYIDSLPVALRPWDVALVAALALLLVWDFSVFPAVRGARVNPVDGLRGTA